jgi:hypothetical protein
VVYSALHLRPGVKDWYMGWLAREHPELVHQYRELYRTGAYAPKGYRTWLAAKIKPLIRAHGLERRREVPDVRSAALGRMRDPNGERITTPAGGRGAAAVSLIAEELPPELSPTLF